MRTGVSCKGEKVPHTDFAHIRVGHVN